MQSASLAPVYVLGIVVNVVALVYAASSGQWAFVGAFALVLLYLSFRYRMLKTA